MKKLLGGIFFWAEFVSALVGKSFFLQAKKGRKAKADRLVMVSYI
jgi:hypothetical protein